MTLACLASNIIEVGVDVPRLSLMAIVGQPKTTSQYIQVSSRVGRDLDKPGLVVVIYGQTKPRDRSHYERFRSYHQRLYAQVEPTSVTPFSPPAVDRALHGLVVALVRQLGRRGQEADTPDPFPLSAGSDLRLNIEEVIRDRVRAIAPDEEASVMSKLKLRLDQWSAWKPAEYGARARTVHAQHSSGVVRRLDRLLSTARAVADEPDLSRKQLWVSPRNRATSGPVAEAMDMLPREQRSALMGRIRANNTKPEMAVRRTAHRLGFRFRLHPRSLPGRPDLVFPRHGTVLFVHSCYWHRHPGCRFAYAPKSNVPFWQAKVDSNIARDEPAISRLKTLG